MHNSFRRLLTREQVCTIPNYLSLFRLALVPFIIWTYLRGRYGWAAVIVLVSAATDILDGFIARRFKMVSDLGKVLDPISDKLTHAALFICLLTRYRFIWPVFALLAVKELTMFALGSLAIRKRETVHSAKWYGKLCTVILETILIALILFPKIPKTAVVVLMGVCCAAMLFSLLMYTIFWIGVITMKNEE